MFIMATAWKMLSPIPDAYSLFHFINIIRDFIQAVAVWTIADMAMEKAIASIFLIARTSVVNYLSSIFASMEISSYQFRLRQVMQIK